MGKYTEAQDIELFKSIAEKDSRALEELYDRYSPLLYSLIKKIVPDQKITEIILVDVFAIVWNKIGKFNFKSGNVYSWLITLARNRAVDNLRRTRSSGGEIDVYDDQYENFFVIPSLEEKIDSLDLQTAMNIKPKMDEALKSLTDAQKYVVHLSYYEGFSLDEIASKLNLPIETVREKLMIAVHNLRESLLGK